MNKLAPITLCAALFLTPLQAETIEIPPNAAPETGADEGFSLMQEGARLLFRGMMDEMEPALEEMRDFARDMTPAMREFVTEMGPAMADILREVDAVRHYAPPEFTPEGDIILRRRADAPPFTPPVTPPVAEDEPAEAIDL